MVGDFDFSRGSRGGRRDGAGRPAQRLRAEDLRRIDVRELARSDLFLPTVRGEWWSIVSRRGHDTDWFAMHGIVDGQNGSVTRLTISGLVEGDFVMQDIALQHTPCNYGGSRPWFTCPRCDRRAAVLYLAGALFQCRRCADVSYLTQRSDACSRAWMKQRQVEWRLRRRGLHQSTVQQLLARLHECEHRRNVWLREWFAKLPFAGPVGR